jgi:hypothetical protein
MTVTVLAAAVAVAITITETIKTATTVKICDQLSGVGRFPHPTILHHRYLTTVTVKTVKQPNLPSGAGHLCLTAILPQSAAKGSAFNGILNAVQTQHHLKLNLTCL